MLKKIELYLKRVIVGHQRGVMAACIKVLLLPLSWFYGLGVRSRNWFYDKGWMRRYIPPVPLVISIGNITVGGTGKTPATLLLAGTLYERFSIAILSRGYRSQAEQLDTLLICEGQGPIFPASYCGDEPYLLAQRFPKATVIVGRSRKKASFLAAKAGAQVILIDDGMQHRRLVRDFDVVVIDAEDPFGQGYLLPRGFLREHVHELARAHLVILNHIQDTQQFLTIQGQLKSYTSAPMVGTNGRVVAIRDFKEQKMEMPKERRVGMFCAIAHPEYFQRTLERLGFEVVATYVLPDHDNIQGKNLEQFAQTCLKKGANWLICTEKDRVKLADSLVLSMPILWVQIELCVVSGQVEWETFLQQAETKII